MNHQSRPNSGIHRGFATLTSEEAATILLVRPPTVYRYIDQGLIRATRIGRRWVLDRASVEHLAKTGRP